MKKIILLCFFLLVFTQSIKSHPDGATPYWYPSDFIYGYINGCAESVEVSQLPFTQELWPVQVRTVCACVVDTLRHTLTYQEISDNKSNEQVLMIAITTFPICVEEVLRNKDKSL